MSHSSGDPSRVRAGLGTLSAQTISGSADETAEAIALAVDAALLADAEGLDAVWTTEHHFAADGYLPTPLLLLAALATRTERIALGTNVLLAPLTDPLRLAEEAAVLDHLSGGRLYLGLGLGYREIEFRAFGRRRAERAVRLEEVVGLLRASWRGEEVTCQRDAPAVTVHPRPRTPGGPPILIGARADMGVDRAARMGDGWLAPELAHPRGFEKRLARLGLESRSAPFHVVANLNGFVAARDAVATAARGASHVSGQYSAWLEESGEVHSPVPPADALPPTFVAGTPADCVARLRDWWGLLQDLPAAAVPHLSMRLVWPGVSRESNLESVRLFAREVVPALRAEIS